MVAHPDEFFGAKDQEQATTVPGSRWNRRQKSDVNPSNEVDVQRLRDSMDWSAKKIRPFQQRHNEAIKYFAGNRYGDNSEIGKTPMNLLHLAVEIWLRQLAAQTPRCLVLTRQPDLKTDAFELEIATDYLLQEINFGASLSDMVRSAIFSMGIMKVGVTEKYLDESSAFARAAGQPYADHVLFEDWLHDMKARRPEEWDWCGNYYTLPYDVVMENPNFDRKVKDQIRPRERLNESPLGMDGNKPRSSELSAPDEITHEEYRPRVGLWDIWIPHQKLVVTLPSQVGLNPLRSKEWDGPSKGMYHILGFTSVPGNIVPGSPAQGVFDLQDAITRVFNKLARQALRSKTLTIADGRAVEDGTAERVMEGEDGQVIRTSHIDGIKEMKYGGADPQNQAFLVWLREIFSYLGGNIDAMGGLAQQAGTLGQEQLLVSSSSEMIRDMQTKVISATKNIVKDLAWYMYTDPLIDLPLTKHVEGFGDIPFAWGPENRKSSFFNYHFDIQPYSLQAKGPQQRLGTIMQLATTLLLPLAPQMEAWGMSLNLQKLVELISKYGDLPEINDLITSQTPSPYEGLVIGEPSKREMGGKPIKPPVTQRNYTRTNYRGGPTGSQSQSSEMIGNLMKAAMPSKE